MNDQELYFAEVGVYLGYSTESIIDFMRDVVLIRSGVATDEWREERSKTRSVEGGHIMAISEVGTPVQDIIDAINSRRFCTLPFPQEFDDDDKFFDELESFKNNEIFIERMMECQTHYEKTK